MKKPTKIISVFLSLLMVFSCIPMTAFAAERNTSSLDQYLSNENLGNIVESLLTDLGARKEKLVPTALNISFQLIDQLKKQAEADGVDVMKADTETLAGELLKYVDAFLEETNLNAEIGDLKALLPIIGIKNADFNSVDGIINALASAIDYFKERGKSMCGDLASLSSKALKTGNGKNAKIISSKDKDTTNLDVVYALFGFIADGDNITVIKKVVNGNLSLGTLNGTIKNIAGLDLEEEVNNMMGSLSVTIKEELYNALLAEKETVTNEDGTTKEVIKVAYADSPYKAFTCDELLAAAVIKAMSGVDATQKEAAEVASLTFYQLFGKYADKIVANYLLDLLNTNAKEAITKLCDMDPQLAVLKNIINLNYEFKADTFNFAQMAQEGLFENLNNMVCTILEVMIQPDVYKQLNLKKGGNENITANLTSFFGFVLKTLSSNNGGKLEFTIDGKAYSYDFSQFTEANIANKSLEDMVVAVLKLFYVDWFGAAAPADADTLEKLGVYTAYTAIDKFMVQDAKLAFSTDYKSLVFNADGSVKNLTQTEAFDAIGTMGMDVAMFWLNRATNIGTDAKFVEEKKAEGWTWEDFFEEIVDWALNYIDGIPAVSDKLETKRGVKDGYGAWYKLNVILNDLINLSFVNDCNDETFTVDVYTLVMKKAAPGIFDCKFDEFANILAMNNKADNVMNQAIIPAVLGTLDHLVFALLEHNCGATATFEKPATATHNGAKGTYDALNGHYINAEVLPATDEEVHEHLDANNDHKCDSCGEVMSACADANNDHKCDVCGAVMSECADADNDGKCDVCGKDLGTVEPDPTDVKLGDVNGDGEINAVDARLALRISAKLESPTDDQIKAADIDGDGNVTASEARKILRYSAKLDTELK